MHLIALELFEGAGVIYRDYVSRAKRVSTENNDSQSLRLERRTSLSDHKYVLDFRHQAAIAQRRSVHHIRLYRVQILPDVAMEKGQCRIGASDTDSLRLSAQDDLGWPYST
ncbi:hypothetical protein BV20DRAFT_550119 [Pilatotrama ljubarskyi]|nr:hypothetical protein BV20DRAFT_550119 [Pilatotrama ljubarskyi]